jgi:hypothetical protein
MDEEHSQGAPGVGLSSGHVYSFALWLTLPL